MEQLPNFSEMKRQEEEMFAALPELVEAGEKKRRKLELMTDWTQIEKSNAQ